MDTIEKVEHLLELHGGIEISSFKASFKKTFGMLYICPSNTEEKCGKLKICLVKHFGRKIEFRKENKPFCSEKICLKRTKKMPVTCKPDATLRSNPWKNTSQQAGNAVHENAQVTTEENDDFPRLGTPVKGNQNFLVQLTEVKKNEKDYASSHPVREHVSACENSVKRIGNTATVAAACSSSKVYPDVRLKTSGSLGSYDRALYEPLDTIQISKNGRSAAFEFELGTLQRKTIPTEDEVNERVNYIRSNLSKNGQLIDVYELSRKLCEYFGVKTIRDLKCSGRRSGFSTEMGIPAIKEFLMLHRRVLCMIQSYCTSATIATLYDLRKYICEVEKKNSFEDLKLGPLQKFPLIWYHFKFPHESDIRKLTVSDVMQYLWHYIRDQERGKKIELEAFLEYVAKKSGFKSPYEMGVLINSIALAISIVRKTRFNDRDMLKQAEGELIESMKEDVNDYLRKMQKGLTRWNQRVIPGQPANVIQKIAGMDIEDCIMNIFMFVENIKANLQMNISASGLFLGAKRIIETMMFFRKAPLLSKFFHVVVASCVFQKIGMDDYELLKELGFKESLRKMTEERMMELFGGAANNLGPSARATRKKLFITKDKLLENVSKWLENSCKPVGVQTLATIEQKVVQYFNGTCFDDFGVGTFLEFIEGIPEIQNLIGSIIVVDPAKQSEQEVTNAMRQEITAFAAQCGSQMHEGAIEEAVRKQFTFARPMTRQHISSLISDSQPEHRNGNIIYLHALDCGNENALSMNSESLLEPKQDTGVFGHLTRDDVVACLSSAPLLEDLGKWSCWDIVFEPQYGKLKSFLSGLDSIHVVETPSNELLKISPDSRPDDLKQAIDAGNAQESAGHLISIIFASGGIEEAPVIHLSNVIKSSLALKLDETEGSFAVERFVLECLLKIPASFCSSLTNKVFLNPLHDLLGDDYGRNPVPARILQASTTHSERSHLHSLGALLAIKEWKADFEESRFRKLDEPRDFVQECRQRPREKDLCMRVKRRLSEEGKELANEEAEKKLSVGEEDLISFYKEETILDSASTNLKEKVESNDECSGEEDALTEVDDEATILDPLEERERCCKDLINEIRQKEFGIGEFIGEKEEALLRKNNDRLCRSLDRLSKELYAKDTHFVLELIQNADDNTYDPALMCDNSEEKPSVAFIVGQDNIVVLNNELGFSDRNIMAICDVGKSTKGAHRKGYIGQKGIGFKSVFRITDCPEIHSNGFHICFDASQDKMGYICPQWCENDFNYFLDYSPTNCHMLLNWKTQINLPLKTELIDTKKTCSRFQNIHPSLLLFLNRLQTVIIENKIDKNTIVMKKRVKGKNLIELTQNGLPSTWFVVTKDIEMLARGESESTEISLAFPLDEVSSSSLKVHALPSQSVFAFLPLRSYGFKFLIQADFEVPSSREDIDRDSSWNQAVLQEIPRLVIESFFKFRDDTSEDTFSNSLYAVTKFFQYLPLEKEILGVFKPIAKRIIQLLQAEECIPILNADNVEREAPVESVVMNKDTSDSAMVDWAKPSEVILGDSMLRKIITPIELKRYLNLNYMSDVMQKNVNPALLKTLGVQSETLDCLLEICKSHLKVIAEEKGKYMETIQWIGKWFLCVALFLERNFDTSLTSLQKIKSTAAFPLVNGDLVSLEGDAVFFPFKRDATSESKKDCHVKELEEDLNTIDGRMFKGLDQIELLKVERFLSELGVRKYSAMEVVQNHILPAFRSGKLRSKEHLVVPFLKYIKEQYYVDPKIVDVGVLKDSVLIKTNGGMVKPTEQRIYFTPVYGNEFNLKNSFPAVEWFLLDKGYLKTKKKDEITSWQKFFRLLGVEDFPKMREQQVSVNINNRGSSPWGTVRERWPSTADGLYQIHDLVCPELEQVLDTKERKQLSNLAQLLNRTWKAYFIKNECVAVKDSMGNNIATTISSFLIKLRTSAWLPGRQVQNDGASPEFSLSKPKELYIETKETKDVLRNFCSYYDGTLNDTSFINAIGIQSSIQLDTVFKKLDEWACDATFATSIDHMVSVYHFIKNRINAVDEAEINKPIIFVPSKKCKSEVISRGKFYAKGAVCLYDFSKVMYRRATHLFNNRVLLFQFYPKDILDFFEKEIRIDKTPTLRDYLNMACALAEQTRLPDNEAFLDLMSVFSVIGQKCIAEKSEDDFQEIVKSGDDIWERYKMLKSLFDETNASFVFENLKEEQVFPTDRNRFVSLKEKPLLADVSKLAKIYEKEDPVHFLSLPDLKSVMLKKFGHLQQKEERFKLKEEKLRGTGILAFFALCKIETISQVVSPPEVNPENSEVGCYEWHKALSKLLPYVQRFLYAEDRDVYNGLIKTEMPEKLENIKFFTANSIMAVHRLRGRDRVNVQVSRKCAVECHDKKIYFYVGRDFMKETEDILSEFVALFTNENKKLAESLLDILMIIAGKQREKEKSENIEKFLSRKQINILPKEEVAWKMTEIEKPKLVSKKLPAKHDVPEADQDASGGMTCWPPRAPDSAVPRETKLQKQQESQWPVPAPPEAMTITKDIASGAKKSAYLQNSDAKEESKRDDFTFADFSSIPAVETKMKSNAKPSARMSAETNALEREQQVKSTQGTTEGATLKQVKSEASSESSKHMQLVNTNRTEEDTKTSNDRKSNGDSVIRPVDAFANGSNYLVNIDGNLPNSDKKLPTGLGNVPNQLIGTRIDASLVEAIGTQSLKYACEVVEIGRINDEVPEITGNLNEGDTTAVGRAGEKLVYMHLKKEYGEEIASGKIAVMWVNEKSESEKPFDIQIIQREGNKVLHLIEVKSTTAVENKAFEISSQQLRAAFSYPELYDLYRVSGIRPSQSPQVKVLRGLAKFLDSQSVNIFILI